MPFLVIEISCSLKTIIYIKMEQFSIQRASSLFCLRSDFTNQQCGSDRIFVANRVANHKTKTFFATANKLLIWKIFDEFGNPFETGQSNLTFNAVIFRQVKHHRRGNNG